MSVPAGPPLGILPADYPVTALSLKKGDRLILLTDGIFDAKDRRGKRIGFDRITRFIKKHMKDRQIIHRVVDHVNDFSKGAERVDDLTLVEIRRV
ncbi:MAG: serine/threonine-protein phosphatase [Nitrospiraceae bacterium]|nr:MAG: serine/threonine-protein phosphatase [Nitrospiraceae bacterium]